MAARIGITPALAGLAVWGSIVFHFETEAAKTKSQPAKAACSKKERALRNCHLRSGKTKIHLTAEKIVFDDKVWRWVHDLPLKGESTEWEKVTNVSLGGRSLLQLWIWGEPQGEAAVQELHWYVLEFRSDHVEQKSVQIVRRRRKNLAKSGPETAKYSLDPEDKHGLKTKGAQVIWFVRDRSGRL